MQDFAVLLNAIATMAWPVLAGALVYRFRTQIGQVIESVRSRGFTLKIGGQELTVAEANEQQRTLIADLQTQVMTLRSAMEAAGMAIASTAEPQGVQAPKRRAVLWVDDNPKNNSYFIEQLRKAGSEVDLAASTAEGLSRMARKEYGLILTDMGRVEGGDFRPTAGLDLLAGARKVYPGTPVVFVTTAQSVMRYRTQVEAAGARITNSVTELASIVRDVAGIAIA